MTMTTTIDGRPFSDVADLAAELRDVYLDRVDTAEMADWMDAWETDGVRAAHKAETANIRAAYILLGGDETALLDAAETVRRRWKEA
jgi:hypothetical protein